MNSTLCDQMCVNTFGNYMCTCHSGFRLNNISNQCEGIPLTKVVALVAMVRLSIIGGMRCVYLINGRANNQ